MAVSPKAFLYTKSNRRIGSCLSDAPVGLSFFAVTSPKCTKAHSVWLWLRPAITEVPFDIRVPYNTDKRWGVPITVLQQKTETITNKKEQTL